MSTAQIEQAKIDSIGSSELLMNHPGWGVMAPDIYPHTSSASIDLVEKEVVHGRYRQSAPSLNFGSTSTWTISPGSILSNCVINAEVTVPTNTVAPDLWLLNAIASIDYSFSGLSSANGITLTGDTHMDMVLACCENKEKRQAIIAASPAITGTAGTYKASTILYLPFSSSTNGDKWPIDSSCLQGNILVNVRWRQGYEIFNGGAAAITPPNAFAKLDLCAKQVNLVNQNFKIAKTLKSDPNEVYAIPMHHIQSFNKEVSMVQGQLSTVTLDALPNGRVAGIIVKGRTRASYGSSGTHTDIINPGSITFDYARLRYNGSDLIWWESEQESKLWRAVENKGAGYEYSLGVWSGGTANTVTSANFESAVLPLYFDFQGGMVGKHMEVVPTYGGSTLEFQCRSEAASGTYLFNVTYIMNQVLMIKGDGTVKILMD